MPTDEGPLARLVNPRSSCGKRDAPPSMPVLDAVRPAASYRLATSKDDTPPRGASFASETRWKSNARQRRMMELLIRSTEFGMAKYRVVCMKCGERGGSDSNQIWQTPLSSPLCIHTMLCEDDVDHIVLFLLHSLLVCLRSGC